MSYLAHSARPQRRIPAQEYAQHVWNVVANARLFSERAGKYSAKYGGMLQAVVRLSAEFHDLGKLDDINQEVLRSNSGKMLNHVDAGVAHLFDGPMDRARLAAAIVVHAHHLGLASLPDESVKGLGNNFRDSERAPRGLPLRDYTNGVLKEYRNRHASVVGDLPPLPQLLDAPDVSPLLIRLALSCLVDADHTDTARNYRDPVPADARDLDPEQRLELLDRYVHELGRNKDDERTRTRAAVYRECRNADFTDGMSACDSPVGTGKTTAIMAHLLQAAKTRRLRRVFVVLPFTNIIDQSVDVYRKSLVCSDEDPQDIVAAHHHRAEFDDDVANEALETFGASRLYAFLWCAPIVVTTAVQFFETLAGRTPAALRKLHHLPGSAIFIDESHAALPAHLWPQTWLWLEELRRDWGCHVVFGSGSLNRFWELDDFVKPPRAIPELVTAAMRESTSVYERRRVTPRVHLDPLDLNALGSFAHDVPGPRLLIVNTVQSAAAIARFFGGRFGRECVEHLSTALTPVDRKSVLERVKLRLSHSRDNDWTLVATSCVECGVDFSFRTGIRERCSLTSLLQTSGRVNRSNEYDDAAVWDIVLKHDYLLRPHPAFDTSARILGELFAEGAVAPESCTEAFRREIRQDGMRKDEPILVAERNANFPEVERLFRVIDAATLTIVVERELISRIERGEKVARQDVQMGSVQIWQHRVQDWGIAEFDYTPGLLRWTLPYDSFLGYMAGVLLLVDGGKEAFIL